MQKSLTQKVMLHGLAILLFIVLAFLYCSPVLQGFSVNQSDMVQVMGMSKEAMDFYAKTGQHPLWSNSMFGGMPTYMTFTGPSSNLMAYVNAVFTLLLPAPVNMLFLAMAGFYFLLCVLDFKFYVRLIGAFAFGFSSFNLILIGAGHVTEMMSLAYMAPVLAGLILTFRGKLLAGGALTALMGASMVYNDHLQIMYYTAILAGCLVTGYLVRALLDKKWKPFLPALGITLLAAFFSVLPASDNLLITREYTNYSTRGSQSELTLGNANHEITKGGLNIAYAFQWSLGKFETLSILVPNIYGGPPPGDFVAGSAVYRTLTTAGIPEEQADNAANSLAGRYYWGPQPFTSPVYFGAVVCLLFLIALFVIRDWEKWWILGAAIVGLLLSWGKHLAFLNDFLFYHLPLYNKFRSPSMALVITQLCFVMLASWALNTLAEGTIKKDQAWKGLKYSFYIAAGLILVIGLGIFLDFRSGSDAQLLQQIGNAGLGQKILSALHQDRATLLHQDALRSFILVTIVFLVLWAFIRGKLRLAPAMTLLTIALVFDLWQVDRRYLNTDNFVEDIQNQSVFQPSMADQDILKDPDPYYRVLNLSVGLNGIFNDALTSYFHKSVGGYSPAKLWRYQDLIDYQLNPVLTRMYSILENAKAADSGILNIFTGSPVLNMLNTKYFIVNPQSAPIENPSALGNAWFIHHIQWAANANQEIGSLNNIDPAQTVVIDQRFKPLLGDFRPIADSTARIGLTQYGLNELQYASSARDRGLAVFSDIYYPAGWKAFIDGKEANILRVNYLLRGLLIPPGAHAIDFQFHPDTYFLGQAISRYSSMFLILLVLVILGRELIWAPKGGEPGPDPNIFAKKAGSGKK